MNSDNNQEMFPLVDEQGNIIGAAPAVSATAEANFCIP